QSELNATLKGNCAILEQLLLRSDTKEKKLAQKLVQVNAERESERSKFEARITTLQKEVSATKQKEAELAAIVDATNKQVTELKAQAVVKQQEVSKAIQGSAELSQALSAMQLKLSEAEASKAEIAAMLETANKQVAELKAQAAKQQQALS
ncbi:hypothetical protein, partial [Pseudomonas syringae]|uniref:hypothetical protein n=1 Tax=Pseudomonas syringae TaxID=317 RepID=UPI000D9482D0